jgi:hypothetical protein
VARRFAARRYERANAPPDDQGSAGGPKSRGKPEANGRAREQDIFEAPALSVELDKKPRAALETLERILGPATFVNRSGGIWMAPETNDPEDKLHSHWRLSKPARGGSEIDALKEARLLATALVGGDGRANMPSHSLARIVASQRRTAIMRDH